MEILPISGRVGGLRMAYAVDCVGETGVMGIVEVELSEFPLFKVDGRTAGAVAAPRGRRSGSIGFQTAFRPSRLLKAAVSETRRAAFSFIGIRGSSTTVVPGGYMWLDAVILASRSELATGTCGIDDVARELRLAPLPIAAVGLLLGETPDEFCPEREKRRPCGLVGEASSVLVDTLRIDRDVNLLLRTAILLAADV